jgi:zinc protease
VRWRVTLFALAACATSESTGNGSSGPGVSGRPAPFPTISLATKGSPIVNLRVLCRAGSVDDPKGKEGLTALTARLIAEGGTRSLSSSELIQKLFPMAADLSAHVDKEMTVFVASVPADFVEPFLPVLDEVFLAPRWDARELARMRSDAIQDIEERLRTSDDENLGKEALDVLLYTDHPYGHLSEGTVQGLKAISIEDAKDQAARVFTRDRMVVAVAAANPDPIVEALKNSLAPLPQHGASVVPAPPRGSREARGPRVLIVDKEAESTAISLGEPWSLKRGDADFYPMMAAVSALGEHRQFVGRLMRELRIKRGLNYGDYAYVEAFHQDGDTTLPQTNVARSQQAFSVWIRPVLHENRLFAIRAALYEITRFHDAGVTAEELELVKGFLGGYTLLWEQTPMRRLGNLLDDAFYGTPGFLAGFRSALPSLDLNSVNALVRKYIDPSALRIVVVTKDGATLKQQLVNNTAATMSYASKEPPEIFAEDRLIESFPLGLTEGDVKVVPASQMFERAEP